MHSSQTNKTDARLASPSLIACNKAKPPVTPKGYKITNNSKNVHKYFFLLLANL